MKVKWEQFAQRRKINLEMFRSMTYEDYQAWCTARRVDPVSRDSYEGVQRIIVKDTSLQKKSPVEEVAVEPELDYDFDQKKLRKMKKEDLLKLCAEFKISIDSKSTKRNLIKELIRLNNK